jgi:hypothetical protein
MYISRARLERTRALRALRAYEAARGIAALFGGLSGVVDDTRYLKLSPSRPFDMTDGVHRWPFPLGLTQGFSLADEIHP